MVLIDCYCDVRIVVSDNLCTLRGTALLRGFFVIITFVAFNTLVVFVVIDFFLFIAIWCCGFICVIITSCSGWRLGSSLFLGRYKLSMLFRFIGLD